MLIGEANGHILIVIFAIGFVPTACSAYVFIRDRKRAIAGIPLWIPLLAAGLAMTLVIPAIALFLGSVIGGEALGRWASSIIPQASAQVANSSQATCYLPPPTPPTATATAAPPAMCYAMVAPTPTPTSAPTFMPPPSCYTGTPPPPSPVPIPGADALMAAGSIGAASIAMTRGELLEKLHGEGRIPEKIYRKLRQRKP